MKTILIFTVCLLVFGEQVLSKSLPPIEKVIARLETEIKSWKLKSPKWNDYTTTQSPWYPETTTRQWYTTTWYPTIQVPETSQGTTAKPNPKPDHHLRVELIDVDIKVGQINIEAEK